MPNEGCGESRGARGAGTGNAGRSAIRDPRFPVLLVSDRTLSARYNVLLEGVFAAMQTSAVPAWFMRRVLSPAARTDEVGRAVTAPMGLRRIEAALLGDGFLGRDDVVVTTPERLGELIGPWTKIVGVSSGDPLGRGMTNTTTSSFYSGELYTRRWTAEMMAGIARAKQRHGFGVVFGGPGAWQFAAEPGAAERLGVDTVVEGYFEAGGVELFADMLAGREVARHVRLSGTGAAAARAIRGGTLLGSVEISRGCGKGCSFCTMARTPMEHFPPELILADMETNAGAGVGTAVAGSEDFFRYGAPAGGGVNFAALAGLLEAMRRVRGVRLMQLDHANIATVAQYSVAELRELRRLLDWPSRCGRLWVNLGVESASGRLVQRVAPGKLLPYGAEDWPGVVRSAAAKLAEAGFYGLYSVILGLPGETPDDVRATRALAADLLAHPAVVFPVFHEPLPAELAAGARRFGLESMWPEHCELFTTCYEANFARVPALLWDNQGAGGTAVWKRLLIQALGRGETVLWRRRLRRLGDSLSAAAACPALEDVG